MSDVEEKYFLTDQGYVWKALYRLSPISNQEFWYYFSKILNKWLSSAGGPVGIVSGITKEEAFMEIL